MIYGAYTHTYKTFPSMEDAGEYLIALPENNLREPEKLSVVTSYSSEGVHVETLDGESAPPESSLAYVVRVEETIKGKTFTIEYVVEFGAIQEEEDHGHNREEGVGPADESDHGPNGNPEGESEYGSEPGFGDEGGVEQPDEGVGEGGEEPVEPGGHPGDFTRQDAGTGVEG